MKTLKLYIAIAYGLAWAAGLAFYLSGTLVASFAGATTLWAALYMFIPLVAVLVCQKSGKEPLLHGIGISWKVNRWWFVGWLLILAIALLTILFTFWTSGFSYYTSDEAMSFGPDDDPIRMVTVTLIAGMVAGATINALFAFGEEVGWRGYLLKQFEGRHFITSAIVIGLIWGLWHAPFILLGHNYPQHPQLGVLFMMVLCIPLNFILQYFRVKSGSVIATAIMHGTFNAVANTAMLLIDIRQWNDLLEGGCGLTGICSLLVAALAIFLFDRYVTRDRICTSKLTLPDPNKKQ